MRWQLAAFFLTSRFNRKWRLSSAIGNVSVNANLAYRTGIAIFDRNDPRKVLYRSEQPVFEPEREWEKNGQVPSVVFVEGMAKRGNEWLFYCGGADKYIGVASAQPPPQ